MEGDTSTKFDRKVIHQGKTHGRWQNHSPMPRKSWQIIAAIMTFYKYLQRSITPTIQSHLAMNRLKSLPNIKLVRTTEEQLQQEIIRLKKELDAILKEHDHANSPIKTPRREIPSIAQVIRRILFYKDLHYLLSPSTYEPQTNPTNRHNFAPIRRSHHQQNPD